LGEGVDFCGVGGRPNPLFENRLLVDQRIGPTLSVKRNNNLSSVIGRCGAHRRKLRTTFWHVYYFFIGITSIQYTSFKKKIPQIRMLHSVPKLVGNHSDQGLLRKKNFIVFICKQTETKIF
jgi:hypothetical protein